MYIHTHESQNRRLNKSNPHQSNSHCQTDDRFNDVEASINAPHNYVLSVQMPYPGYSGLCICV